MEDNVDLIGGLYVAQAPRSAWKTCHGNCESMNALSAGATLRRKTLLPSYPSLNSKTYYSGPNGWVDSMMRDGQPVPQLRSADQNVYLSTRTVSSRLMKLGNGMAEYRRESITR